MKSAFSFFLFLTLCILALIFKSNAQGKGDTWCFGDSVTLSLQAGNLVNLPSSNINSGESSASISDDNGNLLFYCGGYTNSTVGYLKIWNGSHQLIQNGDSILGEGTITNGLVIIPFPSDTNKYYLFSNAPISGFGIFLYYSIIDMSLNSGNGGVIQKNILLYNNSTLAEKLTAIKHGNGRDWWLITHQWKYSTAPSDTFLLFLLTPNGISLPYKQAIGTSYNQNYPFNGYLGEIQPTNNGSKLLCVSADIIDLFDFDRCTGTLSNYQNIAPPSPPPPLNGYYGCSFSPDNSKVYISNWHNGLSSNLSYQLFQLNLLAANIPTSKTIIFSTTNQSALIGQHQIGRNGKIYIASAYGIPFSNNNYVLQNMNLSVINFPDSDASVCGFSSYSISLANRRSYAGLPNIPNYNLGADEGGPCDTILAINNPTNQLITISIYPNPTKDFLFITINSEKNINVNFSLFNSIGQKVITKQIKSNVNNFKVSTADFSEGVYFWKVELENKFSQQGKVVLLK
jgi:hypothetical protein